MSIASSSFPQPQTASTTADGVFVSPLGGGLISVSANACEGEDWVSLYSRLRQEGRRRGLSAVQGNVFGHPRLHDYMGFHYPVSYLARHDTPEGDLRGVRMLALPAGTFDRLTDAHGVVRGACWETEGARYMLIGALVPSNLHASAAEQSAELWQQLGALLATRGFVMTDVVRTWFFNDRILDWYGDFNRVRTSFFNERNIFGTLVPASTGVGASNAAGAALSLDALVVAPKRDAANGSEVKVSLVPSPLQCPANDYKSAFSRAVEIAGPEGRHLLVSGTASIEPGGRTAHAGDLDAQIDLSLRVVAAILESRDMTWTDVSRAILYFPELSWMARFEARRAALGLPPLPAIFAHCDICRDDLLFEIELDAFKPAAT